MAITLTLSQIIEQSGGRDRRMKQLAAEGAFIPIGDETTRGSARRYSLSEAAIACIVARIDRFNMQSSALRAIASELRKNWNKIEGAGCPTVWVYPASNGSFHLSMSPPSPDGDHDTFMSIDTRAATSALH